jgi:UDP-N-acetylglucosamine acyltransferase
MSQLAPVTAFAPDRIHPTAIVDPGAYLGSGVEVGPFTIIQAGTRIGDRTRISSNVFVAAGTQIGADCEVHVGAVLGETAQVRGLGAQGGSLTIGPRTIIREHVTIHRASRPGHRTMIGADCFLLAACHVAHDCCVADGVTIANGTLLAGFVSLGEGSFVSGNVAIHQYVRVGALAMIGGQARVLGKDVPPFMLVARDSCVHGVNVVGMRRAGLSAEQRRVVKQAFGVLYRSGLNVSEALARLREMPPTREVGMLLDFIDGSTRGICRGARAKRAR